MKDKTVLLTWFFNQRSMKGILGIFLIGFIWCTPAVAQVKIESADRPNRSTCLELNLQIASLLGLVGALDSEADRIEDTWGPWSPEIVQPLRDKAKEVRNSISHLERIYDLYC